MRVLSLKFPAFICFKTRVVMTCAMESVAIGMVVLAV